MTPRRFAILGVLLTMLLIGNLDFMSVLVGLVAGIGLMRQ